MNPTNGYYWLVQYCPDMARLEAVNVGVILFAPELGFLRAAMSASDTRLKHRFGSEQFDLVHLDGLKASIQQGLDIEKARLSTPDDLDRFLRVRADEILVTQPRTLRVIEPQAALDGLLADLVEESKASRMLAVAASPRANRVLEQLLVRPEIRPKLVEHVTVEVPVFHKPITVPYGYQNGRFNLIQPVQFDGMRHQRIENEACRHAVEGRSLYEHPNEQFGKMQLVLVADFSARQRQDCEMVRGILEDNAVKLYTVEQIELLATDIRDQGKLQPAIMHHAELGE